MVRAAEEHLAIIEAVADLGTWSWDLRTRQGSGSPRWYALYGRDPGAGSLTFTEWLLWVHPRDRERVRMTALDATSSGDHYDNDFRALLPNGEVRWIESRGRVVLDESGTPVRVIGVSRDVTERHLMHQILLASEDQYRRILETAAEGVWVIDEFGQTSFANQRMAEMLGTTVEEMAQTSAFCHVFPEEESIAYQHFDEARSGEIKRFEIRLKRGDGTPLWVSVSISPMFQSGAFTGVLGMFTDISERRRAEEAGRRREAMLRQMADSMPQLVFTARPDGYHDYFNKRWYEFTGWSHDQAIGASAWVELLHPEDRPRATERWSHSLNTGDAYESEQRLRRASDGRYRWHLVRAEPIYDESGKLARWFGTGTDIHDAREIQDALRRANADLEQFAFAASHDLQEPLRMVTAYTQLLEQRTKGILDQDGVEFMQEVVEAARRMEILLQDLLAYTQAARTGDAPKEHVDLNGCLSEALRNLSTAIQQSAAVVTQDLLPCVQGHGFHFIQLFQNLIGNSIKYRSEAPPRVHVSAVEKETEWWIGVRDNGVGIEPEYQQRIFGVFKRLHGRSVPGSGIGLAICTKIAERYEGRLWVESQPGHGSTFWISLPRLD